MDKLEVEILIRNHTTDLSYAQKLFDFGINNVVKILKQILMEVDRNTVSGPAGFLRDFYISMYKEEKVKDEIMTVYRQEGIIEILENFLDSDSYLLRGESIYSLGKLTEEDFAEILISRFPKFLKDDPINMHSLIFEIKWLDGKEHLEFLRNLVNHKSFLFRWIALEVDNCYEFKDNKVQKILSILLQDKNMYVKENAKNVTRNKRNWELSALMGYGLNILDQLYKEPFDLELIEKVIMFCKENKENIIMDCQVDYDIAIQKYSKLFKSNLQESK